jgi:hypothetical protein
MARIDITKNPDILEDVIGVFSEELSQLDIWVPMLHHLGANIEPPEWAFDADKHFLSIGEEQGWQVCISDDHRSAVIIPKVGVTLTLKVFDDDSIRLGYTIDDPIVEALIAGSIFKVLQNEESIANLKAAVSRL